MLNYVYFIAPTGSPTGIHVQAITSTNIQVTWQVGGDTPHYNLIKEQITQNTMLRPLTAYNAYHYMMHFSLTDN